MEPKTFLHLLVLSGLIACNANPEQASPTNPDIEIPSEPAETAFVKDSVAAYVIDSLLILQFDLSSLAGQRANILRDWKVDHYPSEPASEKVYDLNHDGFDDYTIHYETKVNDRSVICSDVFIYQPDLDYYEYDPDRSN